MYTSASSSFKRSQTCGRGDGVTGQRAGVEDRTERREVLHDLGATTNGADRQATADHLAEAGEIRAHVVLGLRPTRADPEAGDHLVEDEERADTVARCPKSGEKPGRRCHDAHVRRDRLDDDRSDAFVEVGHDVVGRHDRVGHGTVGNAGRARETEGCHTTAAGDEQGVGRTVEVAGKGHDAIAPGRSPGQAHRGTGGLGARVHQPDALAARHPLADRLGELHLAGVGAP